MATRVFSCLLLVTVLLAEQALSIGGEGDGGTFPETQNCTVFFCSFVLAPCQPYNVLASYLTGAIDITFSANLSRCTGEMTSGQAVAWRVYTSSNYSDRNAPLLVTVRQISNGYTTSWNLPDQSEMFGTGSDAISQTLCPALPDNGSTGSLSEVVVDILSRSSVDFSLQISIEPVWNFQLSLGTPLNFTLSGVLSSQVYYFPFPNDSSSLFSVSSSDSSGGSQTCLITSIQETTCPYESTLEQVRFEGEHQTMGNQSTFVVEAAKYSSGGLFIVFIPTTFDECVPGDENTTVEADDYAKNITLTVTSLEPITSSRHAFSWWLPVILFFIVIVLSLLTLIRFRLDVLDNITNKCQPSEAQEDNPRKYQCCKKELEEVKIVKVSLTSALRKNMDDVRVVHMTQKGELSQKYSTYCWYSVIVAVFYTLPAFQALLYKLELLNTNGDQDLCYYNFKCSYPAGIVHSMNNVWSNMVFFLLGVWFIIFVFIRSCFLARLKKRWKKQREEQRKEEREKQREEQGEEQRDGQGEEQREEQRCGRNQSDPEEVHRLVKIGKRLEELGPEPSELPQSCSDEKLEDIEFECKERLALLEEEKLLKSLGVPEFNALYYAIGFAMAMEGVMSGIYHICPTDTNFQFDTAFMFVMGGLVLVKVMQHRHPDLHTHSSAAFLAFSLILLLTFIGIRFNSEVLARIVFVFIMMIIPLVIISLYFYHPLLWREFSLCGFLKNTFEQLRDYCKKRKEPEGARDSPDLGCNELEESGNTNDGRVESKRRSKSTASTFCSKGRIIRASLAAIYAAVLNFIVLMYLTVIAHDGIGMGFVIFLLANLVVLSSIYILHKIRYWEHWTLVPLVWGIVGLLSWGFALYFFLLKRVYITEDTPAQSQESNSECLSGTFYDYHDLWHILAAIALYSTASFILSMDDGLVKKAINMIPAF